MTEEEYERLKNELREQYERRRAELERTHRSRLDELGSPVVTRNPAPPPGPAAPGVVRWVEEFLSADALLGLGATTLPAIAKLEALLRDRLVGQDVAVAVVVDALRRQAVGATLDPRRPLSLLGIGPTGVGKTEFVKLLADGLGRRLFRIDCGQIKDDSAVWQFLGSAQGFVGGEGKWTAALASTPDLITLIDEVEKAIPSFFDLLLAALDEGAVVDRRTNRSVSLARSMIVFTSNLVVDVPDDVYDHPEQARDLVLESGFFRPEFLNRIQFVVPFRALTPLDLHEIATRRIERYVREFAEARRLTAVTVTRALPGFLVSRADVKYGVRDLERLLTKYLTDPIAQALVARGGVPFTRLAIGLDGERVTVELS